MTNVRIQTSFDVHRDLAENISGGRQEQGAATQPKTSVQNRVAAL
jgi:hypothetical protein